MAIGRISGQMLKSNLLRSGTDLAFETTLLVLDVTNSRVGVGTASPARQLHISGTGAVRLPGGTTGERGTGAAGDVRYNSDTGQIEGYTNAWFAMTGGSTLSDQDGNTGIAVERAADQNEIHFFTETSGDVAHIRDNGDFEIAGFDFSGGTIATLVTNGNITLTPNGTGDVIVTNGVTLQTDTADINGGAIDGAIIGAASAVAGTFTTATATSVQATNIKANDGTAAMTIADSTGAVATLGALTVGGNLTVNGTTTSIDSVTLTIEDPLITLAKNNSGGDANTLDQGLLINRGSLDNVSIIWDESADEFAMAVTAAEDGTTAGNITIDSYAALHVGGLTNDGAYATSGLSIDDSDITGTRSNENIGITPAGTGSVVISKADINGGAIDATIIGANTAAAGTFTTATATSVQATNIKANDGTAAITIADSTGAVKITTAFEVDGAGFIFNESSADVDFRFEGNGNANLLFGDAGNDRIGIKTATPAYTLDIGSATDAVSLPVGNTAQRPTGAVGVIRFNSENSAYEGCLDGSTYTEFQMAGDTPIISKLSATGDGSTDVFTGFFSSAPASAANVMIFIDNVYQEPTENYTVSGTTLTFTSTPHNGARIFGLAGFDNTAAGSGGVLRTETAATSFTSSAVTVASFNASSYRSMEAFITTTDSANAEYEVAKALVVHDGTTAYVTVYGQTSSTGSDISTYSATLAGGSVLLQAVSSGGAQTAKVQYSLTSI
jgi:hypothetical protein